ncbi:MAG: NAD(P)H-dependent oxidoreductase subunit E, partial [Spirochaetes bacterium]|nr:NAD(P)H-dependent oxidoreductase subunit E [Spirochaetota bacterium]
MGDYVDKVLALYQNDASRLMDILIDVQSEKGYIEDEAINKIATATNISNADILQTLSFYHFFTQVPRGKYTVYLNNSVVANMMGVKEVAKAFEDEAGCRFGEVSHDGLVGLFYTSCIGMSDQEPAALINGVVFTRLTTFRVKEILRDMRAGKKVTDMIVSSYGDGKNNSEYLKTTVFNNIRKKGPVIFSDYTPGEAIKKLSSLNEEQVIEQVKKAGIRGRGGAGFPTGMKWEFCKKAAGDTRYIFCNADEGEPGTFKDRVILTEYPRLVFEGMVIAGYAIAAKEGILYLRYEYIYMKPYLEQVLTEMRKNKFLGKDIAGKKGFNFDIRIQFGAGAYVCGEESALIESAEGKRGEPRDRPPFPVEKGYLGKPTVVNNVETLCSVVKVLNNGPEWFKKLGTSESSGTKLLSISGDCKYPGIYEVEWGFNVNDILSMVGADEPQAVQVGGPSGGCVPAEFSQTAVDYESLHDAGAIMGSGG